MKKILLSILTASVIASGADAQTLIAHYDFNGSTNDVSGNFLNGTPSAGFIPTYTTGSSYSGGTQAIHLNNGNYVAVGYDPRLNLTAWTITAIVRLTSYNGSDNRIVERFDNARWSTDFMSTEVYNTKFLGYAAYGTGAWGTGGTVSPGQWYCLTATYDGASLKTYVNGTLVYGAGWANAYNFSGKQPVLYIGSKDVNYGMIGDIDDIRIYNGAMQSAQVEVNCPVRVDPPTGSCSDSCYWKVTGNNIIGNNNIFGTLTNHNVFLHTNSQRRGSFTKEGNFEWGVSNYFDLINVCRAATAFGKSDSLSASDYAQAVGENNKIINASSALAAGYGNTIKFSYAASAFGNGNSIDNSPSSGSIGTNFLTQAQTSGAIGGENNINQARSSFAAGQANMILSTNGGGVIALGEKNMIRNSNEAAVIGESNDVDNGHGNVVAGGHNRVNGAYNSVLGDNSVVGSPSGSANFTDHSYAVGSGNMIDGKFVHAYGRGQINMLDSSIAIGERVRAITITSRGVNIMDPVGPFYAPTHNLDVEGGVLPAQTVGSNIAFHNLPTAPYEMPAVLIDANGELYQSNKAYAKTPNAGGADTDSLLAVQSKLIDQNKELNAELNRLNARIALYDEKFAQLEQSIAQICENGCTGLSKTGTNTESTQAHDQLFQSVPNPSGNKAIINYMLGQNYNNATIIITDMNGRVFETIALKPAAGNGSISVELGGYPSQTYLYSLNINGKVVASKKMTVAR